MQRSTPLRDPFAIDDEPSTSAAGRPPQRFANRAHPPLRSIDESAPSGPSRAIPSLGAPRSTALRPESREAVSANTSANPPPAARPLGLSLGLPRNRTAAKAGQSNDPASIASAARQADDAVRNTDSDALLSRLSALKLGYLPAEPFTQEFCSSSSSSQSGFSQSQRPDSSTRRSPLINIGTYLRCSTIDAEVEAFLKKGEGQKQIVSIGAGSDSRYWRLMSDASLSQRLHHYVEIDFDENTNQKLQRILRSSILRSHLDPDSSIHGVPLADLPQHAQPTPQLGSAARRYDVMRSSKYTLLAADVRDLHPDTAPVDRVDVDVLLGTQSTGLRTDLPTLVLFECVLAYIAPEKADWLLSVLGQRFASVEALSYDIALAGDSAADGNERLPSRFGKVMLQNLEMRKLSLPGAKAYPTIAAQGRRFVQAWSSSAPEQVVTLGRSLFSIWSELDAGQRSRLSRLEGLDEVEEIDMLLRHYCVVQARRDGV